MTLVILLTWRNQHQQHGAHATAGASQRAKVPERHHHQEFGLCKNGADEDAESARFINLLLLLLCMHGQPYARLSRLFMNQKP
jgi:hypothetical protein